MSGKRSGKKGKSRVSFAEAEEKPPTQLELMKAELERLRRRDEEKQKRQEEYKKEEIRRVRAQMDAEKEAAGLQLIPGSRLSREEIKKKLNMEEKCLLKEEQTQIAGETAQMKATVGMKHGLHHGKRKPPDLVALAAAFATPTKSSSVHGLPDRVVRQMTMEEIMDLKKLFDLYDVAGVGYVRRKDVHKIASILGFRMTKAEFKTSIDTVIADPTAKVTFVAFLDFIINASLSFIFRYRNSRPDGQDTVIADPTAKVTFVAFLDFIIKEQEGNDPFEEVQQCFRILDHDDKGYVTMNDLRAAADETKCALSNRQLAEMVSEADASGDGQVSLDEFTIIMLRTSAFNFS
ncbi:CETN1-like protein [Mya arenaria]|uniref:CETN1-like protein n=1 Tax=Mya arenaria TaxID=6604 RepID=A0ABY7EHX0_MYAAR|nr:CETN1-like protein [Mya arenaria]